MQIKGRKNAMQTNGTRLVSVVFGLVRTGLGHTQVLGLVVTQSGQVDVQVLKMASGNGLVQDLWQDLDLSGLKWTSLLELWELALELSIVGVEQGDLGKNLVGERAGHDKRGMTSGASQIDQSTISQ